MTLINQKNAWCVITDIYQIITINISLKYVINAMIYQMMAYELKNTAVLNVKGIDGL